MADPKVKAEASKIEFEMVYTKVWLALNGRVKDGQVVQPKLNAKGIEALAAYRNQEKDQELTEFPVHIGFPWYVGGLEQYIKPEALDALKAEWATKVTGRTEGKMTLDISGDVVGNGRIRINRILTPKAYEIFCEPFPTTTGKAKGAKKGGPAPTVQL